MITQKDSLETSIEISDDLMELKFFCDKFILVKEMINEQQKWVIVCMPKAYHFMILKELINAGRSIKIYGGGYLKYDASDKTFEAFEQSSGYGKVDRELVSKILEEWCKKNQLTFINNLPNNDTEF